jgi:transposase
MVRERGYRGGPDHFRHLVACHRPRRPAEAYLRLRTLPGEQAQVDWGHFGHLTIGRARRPLMAFVMVLSYSRQIFLRFFLDARLESFLRGHVGAFTAWQGCPRVLLYDNLKSAVLERQADAIRFHPTLLAFAAHYHYEPRPVAVARGNEKGRVERAVRYVRDGFFAARQFADVDDLNAQAAAWCAGAAADRPCPEQQTLSVRARPLPRRRPA